MKPLIGPLLRAMHRLAKEHNQSPASGLLSAKPDQPARYATLHTACITSRCARPIVLLTDGHAAPLACRLQPTDATYGSGSWFMWNALNGVLCPWVGRPMVGGQRPLICDDASPGVQMPWLCCAFV